MKSLSDCITFIRKRKENAVSTLLKYNKGVSEKTNIALLESAEGYKAVEEFLLEYQKLLILDGFEK